MGTKDPITWIFRRRSRPIDLVKIHFTLSLCRSSDVQRDRFVDIQELGYGEIR